jgi:hypothetical protein
MLGNIALQSTGFFLFGGIMGVVTSFDFFFTEEFVFALGADVLGAVAAKLVRFDPVVFQIHAH